MKHVSWFLLLLLFVVAHVRSSRSLTSTWQQQQSVTNVTHLGDVLSRHARYLVFPPRGFYKLVLGLAVPFDIFIKGKYVAWTINFQFQYALPVEFNQLKLPVEVRSLRSIDRPQLYATLEEYMEGRGLPGRACLLKTVCEVATYPLHHDGLLGQLAQIILTPRGEAECRDFTEAMILGEQGVDCRAAYPACPNSVIDLVSTLQ